jgi:hypothetical protein
MFIGHYQLGQLLPLRVWTHTNARVPTEPDAAPFVQVIAENGTITYATTLPILDRQRVTGYFHYRLSLDARFSAQRYDVIYTYSISGTVLAAQASFEVLPGGDAKGAGIAIHFFRQPSADFVLLQSGKALQKLKNPEVRNR